VIRLPATTIVLSPITAPSVTTELAPIHTLLPIVTPFDELPCCSKGTSTWSCT
jgi:hypothetical protein